MNPHSTKMAQWHQTVQACSKCDISAICGPKITLRRNLPVQSLDLLFVGEAPGASEHIIKSPFVGPAGAELQSLIDEAFDKPIRYNITNAVLCTPFQDSDLDAIRTPSISEVRDCSQHLQNLIKLTTPKVIVALGKIAARSLKLLNVPHVQILHPSAILQSSHPDLEHARAVLTLKQVIKDISDG